MCSRHYQLTAAAAAWIALTAVAAAAPLATPEEMASGDVWITPDAPAPVPSQAAQSAPVSRQLPIGDFWPAEDGATRAAEAPAPPHDAFARERSATGVK